MLKPVSYFVSIIMKGGRKDRREAKSREKRVYETTSESDVRASRLPDDRGDIGKHAGRPVGVSSHIPPSPRTPILSYLDG